MKKISVIILAAGLGTRMKSSLPKALNTLANSPLIDHLLHKSYLLNPHDITIVISPQMEDLKQHLANNTSNHSITINYQNQPLGSGNAVLSAINAKNNSTDVTLILYVDTPLVSLDSLNNLIKAVSGEDNEEYDIAVLSFKAPLPNNYGKLIFNKNNQLQEIIEEKELTNNTTFNICNSGVIAIKTHLLWKFITEINNKNIKNEFYLTDLVKILTTKNYKAKNINTEPQEVQGANSKLELAELEQYFQKQMRNNFLNQGVQLLDPTTVYFSLDTKIGTNVIIGQNVVIGKNTVINDNVTIKPFCHIEGAVIHNGSVIGPFARIRPNTVINKNVHIGNFVEIKQSNIGESTKVNHLSYVGDAQIGNNTNIGAGFITCNYDGVKKHITTIGNFAFVGSNVAVIAPINIGNNTVIAAGSTITSNINDNQLAIARSYQVNKNNYTKKLKD